MQNTAKSVQIFVDKLNKHKSSNAQNNQEIAPSIHEIKELELEQVEDNQTKITEQIENNNLAKIAKLQNQILELLNK